MGQIQIDMAQPNVSTVRDVVLSEIRGESTRQPQINVEGIRRHFEFKPPRPNESQDFEHLVIGVFWDLAVTGIIAPGNGQAQPNFPWFRVTAFGRQVLARGNYQPYDRAGYIALLRSEISNPDDTVIAYLAESLETFDRGNYVAAMVMLGVAAERVFDLLCDSMLASLTSATEQQAFSGLLDRFAMKPKVEWAHAKFRRLSEQRFPGFPESGALMLTAIYDLIRLQRNELGHPREQPPRMPPSDVHASVIMFARYYRSAEAMRLFLSENRV